MRSTIRIAALILMFVVLLVPLAVNASNGPCPDDPVLSASCNPTAPPYYVVINRTQEHLWDRPGTGCQPFILQHPECTTCDTSGDPNCSGIDVDAEVCQAVLSARGAAPGTVYEMCCNCATNPNGYWVYRERHFDGTSCPNPGRWVEGQLPPGTGIDLPTPLIVGGLVVLGFGLLGAGLLVRRRTVRVAQ